MCGRYALSVPGKIFKRFNTSNSLSTLDVNYNISPSTINPVIIRNSPNKVVLMKWGLIPFWAKDPKVGYKTINARAEDIQNKPVFRKPIRTQRCLVPATGFFEWKKLRLEEKEEKFPFYISIKDRDLFSFAGVYDVWKDAEGKEIYSYSIITTSSNEAMKNIHERMPVILKQDKEDFYLDKTSSLDKILKLLTPYEASEILSWPVSKHVNNPGNNSSDLIKQSDK